MKSKKRNLKRLLKSNHHIIDMLLGDISEEESLAGSGGSLEHIRWQTGHLVHSAFMMLRFLGRKESPPENIIRLFSTGADISDDPSAYPSMRELKEMLNSLHEEIYTKLNNLEEKDLDNKVNLSEDSKTTVMDGILFLCTHESYHGGQIMAIRKVLGKENLLIQYMTKRFG
jgi:uncharacterized damage-inducible protein DinB